MTEYIIIIALIAIAAIGVITIFGDNIRGLFSGTTNDGAGETEVEVNPSSITQSKTESQTQ